MGTGMRRALDGAQRWLASAPSMSGKVNQHDDGRGEREHLLDCFGPLRPRRSTPAGGTRRTSARLSARSSAKQDERRLFRRGAV
jgi:hypothetical protein